MRLRPDIINFPCCFSFAWWVSLLHKGLQHQRNIHALGVIDWVPSLNWSESCLPLQQIIQGIFTWMRHYRTRSRRVSRQARMCYHFKLLAYKHELSIWQAACLRACILEVVWCFFKELKTELASEKDPGLESMRIKISWSRWLDLEYCYSRSVALSQNYFRALEFLRKRCRVRRIQVTGRIGIFDNRSEPYYCVKDDIRVCGGHIVHSVKYGRVLHRLSQQSWWNLLASMSRPRAMLQRHKPLTQTPCIS